MPGFIVEVDSIGIRTQFLTEHKTISDALQEAFRSCPGYDIRKMKLIQSKGKKDGQSD